MSMAMSRKSRKSVTTWTPCKLCQCCGRKVVLLRLPGWGSKTDPRWYRVCYEKNWDGNPWFVPKVHSPHPRKWLAEHFRLKLAAEPQDEPQDDFFNLE
jgi:hypothetical protein